MAGRAVESAEGEGGDAAGAAGSTRGGVAPDRPPPSPPASGQAGQATRAGGALSGLRPFSSRAYRYLFVGTALTMTGNFMQQVAQGWLIYDLTSSPTWLGIVSFARGLPMLILALVAGVVVDRFDRRTVLISAQGLTALIALIVAFLIATGLIQPWHVALTAFLSGCLFVLIIPARQALLSSTIDRSQLGPAIALMSTGQNSGRIIGPALAGLLIAALGVAISFAVQAVGFVLALLCAVMLGPQPTTSVSRRGSALSSLTAG